MEGGATLLISFGSEVDDLIVVEQQQKKLHPLPVFVWTSVPPRAADQLT